MPRRARSAADSEMTVRPAHSGAMGVTVAVTVTSWDGRMGGGASCVCANAQGATESAVPPPDPSEPTRRASHLRSNASLSLIVEPAATVRYSATITSLQCRIRCVADGGFHEAFSKAHRTGLVALAALLVLALTPVAATRQAQAPAPQAPGGDRSLHSGKPVVPAPVGVQARRPRRRPSPACRPTSSSTTWAARAAACGRRRTPARPGRNISDGFFEAGSIGAIEVSESNPNVIYVGTGSACPRGNVSPGVGMYKSTDAGKTWQHIGLRNAGVDRPHPDPSDQSRPRLRRGARQPVRAEQGARRLSLARRRHDLGAGALPSATAPAPSTSRWT